MERPRRSLRRVAIIVASTALTVQAAVVVPSIVKVWWVSSEVAEAVAETQEAPLSRRYVALEGEDSAEMLGRIEEMEDGWHWIQPDSGLRSPYPFTRANDAAFALLGLAPFGEGGSIRILDVRDVTVMGNVVGRVEEQVGPFGGLRWRYVEPRSGITSHLFRNAEDAASSLASIQPHGDMPLGALWEDGVLVVLPAEPVE